MVLKIFKAAWFLSVLAVLANLLYVYAGLPQDVIIQDEASARVIIGKEFFFYVLTGLILFVNLLVYVIGKVYRDEDFKSWFNGLIITINAFFIIGMSLVQVYNSNEAFNYQKIGFIIYATVALVVVWALGWPLYTLFRRFYPKQIVSEV
ncbi:hypothetical protein [Chryseosolibacter indicus]|uniref:DUF4293 family protein n=1 Tax=Chryseosolibacter indicus TaxID=2782351 RepID=A0ABS5VX43_9BACT|nr:hypothetical protein [Chryseosolibacter indicus]MBT1705412.1 hypothetical protein [Chryseosolibacter indicus]